MPDPETLIWPFIDALVMVSVLIALTRWAGLRSFAKMAAHDFAMTVAIGSVLASIIVNSDLSFVVGVPALIALYAVQTLFSRVRTQSDRLQSVVDNAPLMIVENGHLLRANMARAKLTEEDVMGKLRAAGVCRMADVRAMVFEPTGDVSILQGEGPVDEVLLAGVTGRARPDQPAEATPSRQAQTRA